MHPAAHPQAAVLVLDAALTVLWASTAALRLFRRPMLGRTLAAIFPEAAPWPAQRLAEALRSERPTYFEWTPEPAAGADDPGRPPLPPGLRVWATPATTEGRVDGLLVTVVPATSAELPAMCLLADFRRQVSEEVRRAVVEAFGDHDLGAPRSRPRSRPGPRR